MSSKFTTVMSEPLGERSRFHILSLSELAIIKSALADAAYGLQEKLERIKVNPPNKNRRTATLETRFVLQLTEGLLAAFEDAKEDAADGFQVQLRIVRQGK